MRLSTLMPVAWEGFCNGSREQSMISRSLLTLLNFTHWRKDRYIFKALLDCTTEYHELKCNFIRKHDYIVLIGFSVPDLLNLHKSRLILFQHNKLNTPVK